MSEFIVSEDFAITPAMREHVNEHIALIRKEVGEDIKISVFLKKLANNDYSAHYQLRLYKKDLLADFHGPDLYKNMDKSFHSLMFQIHKLNHKKVGQRRRSGRHQIA